MYGGLSYYIYMLICVRLFCMSVLMLSVVYPSQENVDKIICLFYNSLYLCYKKFYYRLFPPLTCFIYLDICLDL
jgi:hypothetical protein